MPPRGQERTPSGSSGLGQRTTDGETDPPAPVTPRALLLWRRGEDPGDPGHATHELVVALAPSFELTQVIDAFRCGEGRDLTGYVDGAENPTGDEAISAAVADDGSSFVAVQPWAHGLGAFEALDDDIVDAPFRFTKPENGVTFWCPPMENDALDLSALGL